MKLFVRFSLVTLSMFVCSFLYVILLTDVSFSVIVVTYLLVFGSLSSLLFAFVIKLLSFLVVCSFEAPVENPLGMWDYN